jgi:hypothetical protein
MVMNLSKLKEKSIVAVKLKNGVWSIGIVDSLILTESSEYIRITDNVLDKVYYINDIESIVLLEQKHSENPIVVK